MPGSRPSIDTAIYGFLRRIPTGVLWLIVVLWSLPTLGLAVNSFRTRDNQRGSGWWNVWNDGGLTLENYDVVFSASTTAGLKESLLNSFAIAIPATVIPIAIAAFAAYAFAWIDFKGRKWLFIATVSLLAVPLQVALIPLLKLYVSGAHWTIPFLDKTITLIPDFDLVNTTTAVWLTHTGFALPFAIFLLHNYISELPGDLFEAARIDGADHFTIFLRLVLPLSIPVLARVRDLPVPVDLERLPDSQHDGRHQPRRHRHNNPHRQPRGRLRTQRGTSCPRPRSSRRSSRWWCSSPCNASSCGESSRDR